MAAARRSSALFQEGKPLTVRQKAARIRLVAFDVDGTLTDGKLYFGPQGEVLKAFSVLDGQGLALLKKAGLKLALVTARSSEMVRIRATELKVDRVLQGVKDKRQALLELAEEFALEPVEIAMMGDDWPDLAAFSVAGFAAAPCDAHFEVRRRADWVAQTTAGTGAARELCDYILKAKGLYQKLLSPFLGVASLPAAAGAARLQKSPGQFAEHRSGRRS
jgi:3-deoxy-D-manno-octulosonate 8-phosphate phosphatase (KDO 8-P phosphatase)